MNPFASFCDKDLRTDIKIDLKIVSVEKYDKVAIIFN